MGLRLPDVYSPEKRSEVMRKVHSKGNKSTELKLIALLRENGINGWRRGYPVKGHPDFVFPMKRVAVFADGCFWHGHHCRNTRPENNMDYWIKKRESNARHDTEVTARFESRGWTALRIWECEQKRKNRVGLEERLNGVLRTGE